MGGSGARDKRRRYREEKQQDVPHAQHSHDDHYHQRNTTPSSRPSMDGDVIDRYGGPNNNVAVRRISRLPYDHNSREETRHSSNGRIKKPKHLKRKLAALENDLDAKDTKSSMRVQEKDRLLREWNQWQETKNEVQVGPTQQRQDFAPLVDNKSHEQVLELSVPATIRQEDQPVANDEQSRTDSSLALTMVDASLLQQQQLSKQKIIQNPNKELDGVDDDDHNDVDDNGLAVERDALQQQKRQRGKRRRGRKDTSQQQQQQQQQQQLEQHATTPSHEQPHSAQGHKSDWIPHEPNEGHVVVGGDDANAESQVVDDSTKVQEQQQLKDIDSVPFNKQDLKSDQHQQRPSKRRKDGTDDTRYCIGRKPVTDFVVGQSYSGKVIYIKSFGVFIDIGCHTDAFCHVSRLVDGYVTTPGDVLQTGQIVSARVVEIQRSRKRVVVSLQSVDKMAQEIASSQARQERMQKRIEKIGKRRSIHNSNTYNNKNNTLGQHWQKDHEQPNGQSPLRASNHTCQTALHGTDDKKESTKTMQSGRSYSHENSTYSSIVIQDERKSPQIRGTNSNDDDMDKSAAHIKRARKLARRAARRSQPSSSSSSDPATFNSTNK